MLKRVISMLSAVALLATISISVSAKNPPLPENFTSLSIEERMEWIDKNVQPDLDNLEQGLLKRNNVATASRRTTKSDGVVFIADMQTSVEWTIDGNGNVLQFNGGTISAYPGSDVFYTSANDDIYAYMPNVQTVRATLKTEFIYIPVAQHYPYMHVYHLYGDGKYGFTIYE